MKLQEVTDAKQVTELADLMKKVIPDGTNNATVLVASASICIDIITEWDAPVDTQKETMHNIVEQMFRTVEELKNEKLN